LSSRSGLLNYVVWSEVMICPQCGRRVVFFDEAVDTDAIETVRGEKGIHEGGYDS
jgi:hypothetical protein